MTFKGIEVTGTVYENEDETARSTATEAASTAKTASQTATTASETATQASETATQASQTATQADEKIGDLADLKTVEKTDLVSAINEVGAKEPSAGLTCGYFKAQIPAGDDADINPSQLEKLIGKSPSMLAVGQGVLFQGVAQRANATECLSLSIFLEKTASGFINHEALDGTGISVMTIESSGASVFINSSDSAVTLFLNVVAVNASVIKS